MKKSTVLMGVGVLLAGSWIGASWYTGKILDENKDAYIQLANEQLPMILAAFGNDIPPLQLDLIDFKRGVFSSNARFILHEKNRKQNGIYLDSNIEHGPFPLSELISFNLAPKAGVIKTMLEKNELAAPLFAITQQQNPFVLKVIPATDTIRSELEISPVDFNGLKTSKIALITLLNEKEKWLTIDSKIDSMFLNYGNGAIQANGFTFNSTVRPGQTYYYTGNQNVHFDKLNIQDNSPNTPLKDLSMKNINFANHVGENEQHIIIKQTLDTEQINLDSSDFGAMALDVEFDKVDGNAFMQFNSLMKTNPERAIKSFLNSSPEVTINDFSWKNNGGTGHYSAKVQFKPTTKPFQQLSEEQLIAEIVKHADSQLSLPLPMVKDFIANALSFSEKISINDAEDRVNAVLPLIPMYLKKIDKNALVIMNGDGIQSKVRYEDNQITINGKTKSFNAFWDAFDTAE